MLKKGQDRKQIQMWSLESAVASDSLVRVVDVLVDALDLETQFIVREELHIL